MLFTDGDGLVMGYITFSGRKITLFIMGQCAVFNLNRPVSGQQSFQLCSDENTLTLYDRCARIQTLPFELLSLTNVMIIGLNGHPQTYKRTFNVSFISRERL